MITRATDLPVTLESLLFDICEAEEIDVPLVTVRHFRRYGTSGCCYHYFGYRAEIHMKLGRDVTGQHYTLIHELAHAILWIRDHINPKHGRAFWDLCIRLCEEWMMDVDRDVLVDLMGSYKETAYRVAQDRGWGDMSERIRSRRARPKRGRTCFYQNHEGEMVFAIANRGRSYWPVAIQGGSLTSRRYPRLRDAVQAACDALSIDNVWRR